MSSDDRWIRLSSDAFVQIMQQEGVGALWNGTFPSLLLVLNPAVQFMLYEGLKRQLMRGVHREVRAAAEIHRPGYSQDLCCLGNSNYIISDVKTHADDDLLI